MSISAKASRSRRSAFARRIVEKAIAEAREAKVDQMQSSADYSRAWDFLTGSWAVRHKQLVSRLTEDRNWIEFDGACVSRPMMDRQANVDDYVINSPRGSYRAMAIRAFDIKSGQWSIWWIDSRFATTVGEPVRGGFTDGIGTFFGDDTHSGKPITVRFIWSEITADGARWEQAFTSDGGNSWETNWIMKFSRSMKDPAP